MAFFSNIKMRQQIMIALLFPIVGLIVMASMVVMEKRQAALQMDRVEEIVEATTAIGTFVHEMQRERGASAVFIGSRGQQLATELPAQRKRTDETQKPVEVVLDRLEKGLFGDRLAALSREAGAAVRQLATRREEISALRIAAPVSSAYFTMAIGKLMDVAFKSSKAIDHKEIVANVTTYINYLQAKERSGQERATGAPGFAAGKFEPAQFLSFVRIGADQATYYRLFQTYATEAQRAMVERIVSGESVREVERMRAIALQTGPEKELNTNDGAYWFRQTTARIDLMKQVEDALAKEVIEVERKIGSEFKLAYMVAGGASVALIVVAFLIGTAVARGVERSVGGMTDSMKKLSTGDFNVDVPGRGQRNEIGEMASAVEVFKDSMIRNNEMTAAGKVEADAKERRQKKTDELIKAFEKSISEIVKEVATAAQQMQQQAETMTSAAEQTTRQAATVTSASEAASTNVQAVASATEELSSSVQEISRQVTQSTVIAGKAVDEAKRTDHTVSGLAEGAQKIGEIVELIRTIASQTNLLALNATIEAARAGDAGKGFAVVASEVKNLANQTAKATEDITAQIAAIQSATGEAVSAIKGIGGTIGEINSISGSIAAAVQEQDAATREIARSVQQASSGTQEVSSNIHGVTETARGTGAAAQEVLGSAKGLNRQAVLLRGAVDGFLTDIRAT